MDCVEAQSLIVPFIEKQLNDEQTEAFLQHIEHCSNCYDELEVYFIIFSVTRQLDGESADVSDFKEELKKYIQNQRTQITKRRSHHFHKILLLVSAALFSMIILAGSYIVWNRKINVPVYVKAKIEQLLGYNFGEVQVKSVEQTLDLNYEQYSGFQPLYKILTEVEQDQYE